VPAALASHKRRTRIKIWAVSQGGQWFATLVVSFKGEGDIQGEVNKESFLLTMVDIL
jgi:hypothetical protein